MWWYLVVLTLCKRETAVSAEGFPLGKPRLGQSERAPLDVRMFVHLLPNDTVALLTESLYLIRCHCGSLVPEAHSARKLQLLRRTFFR